MQFVTGGGLREALANIGDGKRLFCAVAFWGSGAARELIRRGRATKQLRIVCNLKTGGTNPTEIERLMGLGAQVRQLNTLHAKVYIGDETMLVASANASANGLGFEGLEQRGWVEAGMYGALQSEVLSWFEETWRASRDIDEADLAAARIAWRCRRAERPPLASFGDFDPLASDFPLIDWVQNSDWTANETGIRADYGSAATEILKRIADAVDLRGPADEAALKPGRWVLRWTRTARGRLAPDKFEWVQVGDTAVRRAYRYDDEDEFIDVLLPAEALRPPPFDAADIKFRDAFKKVLQRDEFKSLRDDEWEGAWFTPARVGLMPDFWRAVKGAYS